MSQQMVKISNMMKLCRFHVTGDTEMSPSVTMLTDKFIVNGVTYTVPDYSTVLIERDGSVFLFGEPLKPIGE